MKAHLESKMQIKYIGFAILLIVSCLGCSSFEREDATPPPLSTPSRAAWDEYSEAASYVENKEYEEAKERFDKIIEKYPNFPEAYYMRGTSFYNLGDFRSSFNDFDYSIKLMPDNHHAYYGRGISSGALGYTEEAIWDLEKYLETATDPFWRKEAEDYLVVLKAR